MSSVAAPKVLVPPKPPGSHPRKRNACIYVSTPTECPVLAVYWILYDSKRQENTGTPKKAIGCTNPDTSKK